MAALMTLGADLNAANGPMTFSGTLSRTLGANFGGGAFHNGLGADFRDLDYSDFTASVAPDPAVLLLTLVALGGLGVAARRRKTA